MFSSIIWPLMSLSLASGIQSGEIRTSHARPPENVVRSFAGRCDVTSYVIAIRSDAETLVERLMMRVGSGEVSAESKASILSGLAETTIIIDAVIHDCGPPGSSRAQIRLITVDRPWLGNPNRSVYFWLSAAGEVSDVTFN